MKHLRTARTTLIYLVALLIFPLAGSPKLWITWPVIFSLILCSILVASQPEISKSESDQHRVTDKGTVWWIVFGSAIGQIIIMLEWAYWRGAPTTPDALALAGVALMVGGTAFRVWSIRTLDRAFSATVRIKEGQQLITHGPYRWLRHPSYTGGWLVFIGSALLFHSWVGLLIMGPGMFWVYTRRIATEERTLEEGFGADYREMKKRTWRMVPGW